MEVGLFDELCGHENPRDTCGTCLSDAQLLGTLSKNAAWLRSNPTQPEVEAADTVANVSGSRYRLLVLAAHRCYPEGLTDDAVAKVCDEPNMPPPRAASRRGELAKWGWLEPLVENGKKVTRPTRTGHPAQVWVLTEAAQRLIEGGAIPEFSP